MPRFSRLTVEKNRLGAAEAEHEILKAQLAAAEKRGQGLRAAYECLLEALIQATIKIAVTEAEVEKVEAVLSSQLAEKTRQVEKVEAVLSAQLAEKTQQLEAVLQSSPWRITDPVRRIVKIIRGG
jgi:hypothetical protein